MTEFDKKDNEIVRKLAREFECITEIDFIDLTGVTPGTAEAWRKRSSGPKYVLLGNNYFYPISYLRLWTEQKFQKSNVKDELVKGSI